MRKGSLATVVAITVQGFRELNSITNDLMHFAIVSHTTVKLPHDHSVHRGTVKEVLKAITHSTRQSSLTGLKHQLRVKRGEHGCVVRELKQCSS